MNPFKARSSFLLVWKLAIPGLVLSLLVAGCLDGAELDNAAEFKAPDISTGTCDPTDIFADRCSGSICHGAGDAGPPGGGVELIAAGFESGLVDQPASYPNLSDCPTTAELLIDSSDPSASLMLKKLTGTHSCGDGMPVPYPVTALSDDEYACVELWVNDLAAQAGGTQ